MNLRHSLAPLFLSLMIAVSSGLADSPSVPEKTPEALAREIVGAKAGAAQKGLGDWLHARIETYDFAIKARQAWENVTQDPAFLASQEFKDIDEEKQSREAVTATVLKFMEGDAKYSAGTVAWLRLFFSPAASWEQSHPLYQKVAEERADDFIPKAFIVLRPVKTSAALPEWYSVFEDAYASAATGRERAFCLLILPAHVSAAADIPGAEPHLQKLSAWLDNLEKTESVEHLPALRDIGFIRFLVCVARRDYASATIHAKPAGFKIMEPLLLLLSGQPDEARAALAKLQRQPVLSEEDQRLLDITAALLRESDAAR